MEMGEHVDALRREGTALLEAARAAGLAAPVPACPAWDIEALLRHIGGIHAFWSRSLADRIVERPEIRFDAESEGVEPARLIEWCGEGLDRLLGLLVDTEPTTPIWNWTSRPGDVSWVARRMAHETAVHRWDAEGAVGSPAALDAALASDGIDEYLFDLLPRPRRDTVAIGGSAHLHCTDVPGEWLVADGDDGSLVVTREHAKGSCALRGPANDLLLVVWGRAPVSSIDLIGDADVAARLLGRARR